ncbi:MAG TPA: DNA polymerase III subunit alpha [Edaphocola sp.]|nr:DNA polymerase III subunit alpha [Edaphocola sp.]
MLLNLHSYYSLRYGTLSIEQLVENLAVNAYDTAVLTDINNTTATFNFVKVCQEKGIHPLAGVEFRNGDRLMYIGIAQNMEGFSALNKCLTNHNKDKKPFPEQAPELEHTFIIYPFGSKRPESLKANEYIGIAIRHLSKIALTSSREQTKYVIWHPVSFNEGDYALHTQLRAIDHNILHSQLKPEQIALSTEQMIPRNLLLQYYRNFPTIIKNTASLLECCSFNVDFSSVKNKKYFSSSRQEDKELLLQRTFEGFENRYDKNNQEAKARISKELEIIDNLNFSSYFLITNDICRFAKSQNMHYIGRGSGANSIVAYCLGITNVDPITLNLYFERFLNPQRKTPPDFDVDFSWKDRDSIYDYIFKKYGSERTALMGAMSTFRSRSIIRELGKIQGLPKFEIDRLISEPENVLNRHEQSRKILSIYERLANFPNQRTIHSSGVLISELPMSYYCALDYPPKGLATAQMDMYTAEDMGFEKFDILSQRGIGHIDTCKEIILANRGEEVDTNAINCFLEDEKIAYQLKNAQTIGCFYIESPAMRQLLEKLKCDNYLTLIAASSIIRPGVASSGMMKAFIERHLNPEKAIYPHPIFEAHLKETYGVMVYQEDVMKIGHFYGGLDMAEADVLRRMMSGKTRNKEKLDDIKKRFFENCQNNNYPEAISKEIWRQMESFAGYSFNKAHSASFAVESYQSLFLKTYYPLEFMVAVLNNYGGFYNRKLYVNEAKKAGATICLPCVNISEYQSIIKGTAIYLGFDGVLSLDHSSVKKILKERHINGLFTHLEDFIRRTRLGLATVIILIRCGAFRFTGQDKKTLLWEAHLLIYNQTNCQKDLLFQHQTKAIVLPNLEQNDIDDAYDEIELLGFLVSCSPFDLAKSDYNGNANAKNLSSLVGQTVRVVADYVCHKSVWTKQGKKMKFGTFLDSNGDFIDTIHFPPQLYQYPLYGEGLYLIQGKVVLDFGVPSIEVEKCARMPMKIN